MATIVPDRSVGSLLSRSETVFSFRTKFDALDAAYPFLGARMVEAP